MMQIKNKLHLLPLFLISYLGLFALININRVMAMDPKLPRPRYNNRNPVHRNFLHNLTTKENIINLTQKIDDNETKITNIDKTIKENQKNIINLKQKIYNNATKIKK
ncbi:MAG: SVM family protein [Candidatus Phytoplasma australasiaticum]|nr:SVM family protein [Candidatus Phytoplasma australasiaticum]